MNTITKKIIAFTIASGIFIVGCDLLGDINISSEMSFNIDVPASPLDTGGVAIDTCISNESGYVSNKIAEDLSGQGSSIDGLNSILMDSVVITSNSDSTFDHIDSIYMQLCGKTAGGSPTCIDLINQSIASNPGSRLSFNSTSNVNVKSLIEGSDSIKIASTYCLDSITAGSSAAVQVTGFFTVSASLTDAVNN